MQERKLLLDQMVLPPTSLMLSTSIDPFICLRIFGSLLSLKMKLGIVGSLLILVNVSFHGNSNLIVGD